MAKQGVKGPGYRFIHGNTKEMAQMAKQSYSTPMDISHHVFLRVQPHFYSWIKQYGMNLLYWSGPKPKLLVTDPEMIKEILNHRDGTFLKLKPRGILKKLTGEGILIAEGKKWTKLRRVANHAFHGESLKSMIPDMITSTEIMLEKWKQNEAKEVEIYNEFRLLTSDAISRTAFGRNFQQGNDIFDMLMKLIALSAKNLSKVQLPGISKILRSEDDIESEKLEKRINKSMVEMIKDREEKVKSGEAGNFGNDYLGLLLKSNYDVDPNKRVSEEEMIDESRTFYFVAQETTNSLLLWTTFLLAIHTDWQEKVRKEVQELFGQQIPNSDGIAKLKTMTMILNESLRLYPPIPIMDRKVAREVKLGNITVPANVEVTISSIALHNDLEIWGEDVHLFKPERFSEGIVNATKNNMAVYLPFGLGPHMCVGQNFATTQVKIALSIILQRYKFTLSPHYVHSPLMVLALLPQHGIQILLHPI